MRKRNMRKVGIACVIALRCSFSHEVALNFRFRSSLRRGGPAESGSNLRHDDLAGQQGADALDGIGDVLFRICVRKANVAFAMNAEAGAGDGCNAGFFQHAGL